MEIRDFRDSDITELPRLFVQLGYPSDKNSIQRRLQHILANKSYHLIVALEKNRVVGFAGFCKMFYFEKEGSYTRILALVVEKDYQKQGIGTKLVHYIKKWSLKENCQAIALNSGIEEKRVSAHKFYESYGFAKKSAGFIMPIS